MMKTMMCSLALVLLGGVAAADTPPAKGAPAVPAKDPAKTPAAEKAAPPAGKPAEKAPAPPAAMPELPRPPQELADLAKTMTGTWRCTGTADMGGTMIDVKST